MNIVDEALVAYVDGELTMKHWRRIDILVRTDPDLQARVALLRQASKPVGQSNYFG